jgi:hypothetical protein
MIKAQLFMTWLMSLRKNDGEKPGDSSYGSHQAGLFNLFRDYKVPIPRELKVELKNHFIGLKRTISA